MTSAKTASAIDVRIDDVGSILKFCIGSLLKGVLLGLASACVSILNFRIGSVSSIGGLIAATLFADTVSDSQSFSRKQKRTRTTGTIFQEPKPELEPHPSLETVGKFIERTLSQINSRNREPQPLESFHVRTRAEPVQQYFCFMDATPTLGAAWITFAIPITTSKV